MHSEINLQDIGSKKCDSKGNIAEETIEWKGSGQQRFHELVVMQRGRKLGQQLTQIDAAILWSEVVLQTRRI